VLYPLVFCVYNIIAIIDGLIYFHQSSRLSGLHAGLIALGTVILLAGVVCLSWRLEDADDEPTSPAATKHMGKVQMPQTVLQPGIGLVHGHLIDELEEPLDIEAEAPGLHGSLAEQAKRKSVDERTPLLQRAGTGPALTGTSRSQKRSASDSQQSSERAGSSLRKPPRRRRMTISEETDEIWAELNDRDSLPSPARRSADLERRPRSGTLPARRKNTQSTWLNQMHRRSWFDSLGPSSERSRSVSQGKRPVDSSTGLLDHPDPEDGEHSDTDVIDTSTQRRGTWGFGQRENQSQEALGDWFRLKWWRKRWREGDEGRDPEER
jgi:hypothetical protein